MITVRAASPDDAGTAIDVVHRSIVELCASDHRNDPYTLSRWLDNKTRDNFVSWLSNAANYCVVAHLNERLVGVGLLHRGGEVRLFFVAPDALRQGVGKAIHAALEDKAAQWGMRVLHLESTALARPFYEALGYQSNGAAKLRFGVLHCYPYEKILPQPTRTAADRLH